MSAINGPIPNPYCFRDIPIESEWDWEVTLRYNDTVEWPKVPGEIAIQTRHKGDSSKDFEVEASKTRTDVTIEVRNLRY